MKQQEIEQQVKAGYDQLPYPGISSNTDPKAGWTWVNIDWIGSLMPDAFCGDPSFKRILIAGCGTGNEAFQMQNRFPHAEITAVDYSEASIRIAQEYQDKHPGYTNINFEVGDLTVEESNWVRDSYYDFISCHGAMTYIPNTQSVFDLLAKCLSKEGVFYLGVNGATHCGVNIRRSFEYLGHNPNLFKNTLESRRLLELIDRLQPNQNHIASHTPTYIDSDILNTFSLNLSLSEWVAYAEKSGFYFLSSAELIPSLGKTLSPNIFSLLFPRSRKELCQLIAINTNIAFHRLVFSKKPPAPIPWHDPGKLLDCEFQTTWFYKLQNPISDIYGELMLNAWIASGYEVSFRWPIDDVSLKLLRQQEGSRRILDALGESIEAYKNNEQALLSKLFMFYQLGIIKILPGPSEQDSN